MTPLEVSLVLGMSVLQVAACVPLLTATRRLEVAVGRLEVAVGRLEVEVTALIDTARRAAA